MKLKSQFFCIFLGFINPVLSYAYPWVFYKENNLKPSQNFEIYAQSSYFVNSKLENFSGVKASYYNSFFKFNTGWTYALSERQHYFYIKSLSVKFPFFKPRWHLHIGFRDLVWSEADRYWNYGLWQPRFMLDVFRPVSIGIPGIYFDYQGKSSFTFLISYLYIPDLIIRPKRHKNQLVSANSFFINSTTDFKWNFDLLKSFHFKRLLKPVIAFQVKHDSYISKLTVSYAYKPVNQLRYSGLFKSLDLSQNISDKLTIKNLKYNITSHHLASLESKIFLADHISLYTSLIYEKPEQIKATKWISDASEPHFTLSVVSHIQDTIKDLFTVLFTIGYVQTAETAVYKEQSNSLTEDLEEVFGRHFNWKQAFSMSLEYHTNQFLQGVLFRLRANYAIDNGIYAIALENHFYLSSVLKLSLSGDVLFRLSDKKLQKSSSSIKKYLDLSRLYLGASYVF